MGRPGVKTWTWTLFVYLSWMSADQALAGPQYMVTIPAVIEAGAETQLCMELLKPNETLVMTVTLKSKEQNITLTEQTSNLEFHHCFQFTPHLPSKQNEVRVLEVEVRGPTFYSKQERKVLVRKYAPSTFIQTDKPIYLPGQTVNFRVVSMDSKFRPANELYNIIEIEDFARNRIGQWLNETSNGKILQLSHFLNSEAREGIYRVIVTIGDRKVSHSFKVEKYVLPKFEVKLTAPDEVSIGQEEFKIEACAKYTYGQPVPGNMKVDVQRPLGRYYHRGYELTPEQPAGIPVVIAPSHVETKQTDKTGCVTFTIAMSNFTKVDQKVLRDSFQLKASMEEEGTGILYHQQKRIEISYVIGKLSFIDTPKHYDQGSDVTGKVKAVRYDNRPIPDMKLYLLEGERWSARLLQNLTTDSEGVAAFTISTEGRRGDINLHINNNPSLTYEGRRTPYHQSAEHTVSLAQASAPDVKTTSSLGVQGKSKPLLCDQEEDISIKYTLVGEEQGLADLMYLVLARGAIVKQGNQQVNVEDKTVTEGQISFKLKVTPDMAPDVQVVAYAVLPSETVIANSADFSTEKCFAHKVSLEFSPASAVPGEENTLQVTAQPNSLCGVSAVDQSVLIKEPGKKLNREKIFDLLPIRKSHVPYEAEDRFECLKVRSARSIYFPRPRAEDDAFNVFQSVGLKMATNLFIRTPTCLTYRGESYHRGIHEYHIAYDSVPTMARMGVAGPVGQGGYGGSFPIETVRSFFPETWIWDLVEVGASGTEDVSLTVPDTITTWETEAFCLSSEGFGLAPRKEFTVFQPFFLELSLPYSIIRGENFELKATVFNYLPNCIMVTVTPAASYDYTLTPLSGDKYTSCLCANERKTVSWTMDPTTLGEVNVSVSAEAVASHASCDNEIVSVPERGRIDRVTKSLIVKAEGIEVTKTHNWLLCPKDEALTGETEIQLPDDMIPGSDRALVSVLGDILGRALNNLDGLLRMPYGCGEQNMALLAPNIYILQYLKNTQQLTAAIKEKAFNFLNSGYQRQLNYKHDDGAFSTFGHGPGNTWLTAFVVRSFAKAQSFVFIDPSMIKESKEWLESRQRENGCFEPSGNLFNNRMKGGVSDVVTLSAYITAAFLEMNPNASEPVVSRSLSCLKESISETRNTYTTALLAYVFTLAGDMDTRAQLLGHLDTVGIQEGGFLHWSQSSSDTSSPLSVEISSYVLLARLGAFPTAADLGYSSRIIRWLTTQQNYYGGFSSTQDTVVALQALALYATLVYSPEGSSTVTIQAPSGPVVFDVNTDNKLLYQEQVLKYGAGKYNLEVKGNACASTQISVHYNIPTPPDVTTLKVEVNPEVNCASTSRRPRLTLKFGSLYTGMENTTNMVILDVKMLSGFTPDPESVKRLKGVQLVDRVEEKGDHILVYIQELPKDIPINLNLQLIQQVPVNNLKPAVVKIYDYYQPDDKAETTYIYPCTAA